MTSQGQTILEYALLIMIVTMVLVYMGTDFKRGIQSMVKVTADQLGNQANSDQDFSYQSSGFLMNSSTRTWQRRQQLSNETQGIVSPKQGDFVETLTNTLTNAGSSQ